MTNQIALGLGALILLFFGVDYLVYQWDLTVFLGRKLVELIEWMAFWR